MREAVAALIAARTSISDARGDADTAPVMDTRMQVGVTILLCTSISYAVDDVVFNVNAWGLLLFVVCNNFAFVVTRTAPCYVFTNVNIQPWMTLTGLGPCITRAGSPAARVHAAGPAIAAAAPRRVGT